MRIVRALSPLFLVTLSTFQSNRFVDALAEPKEKTPISEETPSQKSKLWSREEIQNTESIRKLKQFVPDNFATGPTEFKALFEAGIPHQVNFIGNSFTFVQHKTVSFYCRLDMDL